MGLYFKVSGIACLLRIIVNLAILLPVAAAVNFQSCISEVRNGTWGSVGGTDNHGHPVSDISTATAITYELCLRACGPSSELFGWFNFAQGIGTWLLPWLALISQLPFGANVKIDNLISVLLTVGCPTLAAYSLALTVLNGQWITRRFSVLSYPNTKYAVQILSSLQQSPLKVNTSGSLLISLVVLSKNDEWWSELVVWLNYTHTWSVSAVTSIAWVVLAYIVTLINALADPTSQTSPSGVGFVWLWLLPVVIGWLQLSPKCDSERLRQAIERANRIAYVATPSGEPVLAKSSEHAISLSLSTYDSMRCDEQCSVPIYNYTRFFSWTQAVEDVLAVFRTTSDRAHEHHSVDPQIEWRTAEKHVGPSPSNRMGTKSQVEAYCLPVDESEESTPIQGRCCTHDILVASLVALSLQWGTTGAAITVAWFTPTIGLGCHSASYLIYGVLSTTIWIMLVLSSFLSHYSTATPPRSTSAWISRQLSIILRRLGKVVASFNAIWLIVSSFLQLGGFFQRCYCSSSVMGLGARAYNVIMITAADRPGVLNAAIGSVCLAGGSAMIYVIFMYLFVNPKLPES